MINISDEVVQVWTSLHKSKRTQSGWISANAVCCHHNGHSKDNRGRGGLLSADDSISYHCFNCGFIASWQRGRRLNYKMRKLMGWMGFSDDDIRKLSLLALTTLDQSIETNKDKDKELPSYTPKSVCPGLNILDWVSKDLSDCDKMQLEKVVEYLNSRGLTDKLDQFNWTNEARFRNRVLLPFSFQNVPVGFTARLITDTGKPKYINEMPSNFVFNYDRQLIESKFCLVMEGPFDAVALDGLAVLHEECNEVQAVVIESLNKEVIVVPDRDKTGIALIKNAMEYGWNVSFPDWNKSVKDVSKAVELYGPLFTMKTILNSVETSNLKIQLMSKKWL